MGIRPSLAVRCGLHGLLQVVEKTMQRWRIDSLAGQQHCQWQAMYPPVPLGLQVLSQLMGAEKWKH